MALSGLPPPLPPQMAVTFLMMSPALTPLDTASLPQTARKVILPSLTADRTATTLGCLSRSMSPIWRSLAASALGRVAVSTFSSPRSWPPMRKRSVSPAASLAWNFSTVWRISRSSAIFCSAFSRSSAGFALRTAAVSKRRDWARFMVSRDLRPVVASMRRTPEATENSLSMWNTPTLAVLSRWVPPQNSTEKPWPMSTTRTVSPYFSPNRAMAPRCLASSMGSTSVLTS